MANFLSGCAQTYVETRHFITLLILALLPFSHLSALIQPPLTHANGRPTCSYLSFVVFQNVVPVCGSRKRGRRDLINCLKSVGEEAQQLTTVCSRKFLLWPRHAVCLSITGLVLSNRDYVEWRHSSGFHPPKQFFMKRSYYVHIVSQFLPPLFILSIQWNLFYLSERAAV